MVVNKRKKVGKYRGGSTHGGGARKKRRGSGSRGGRGMAGSGKRAGHRTYGIVLGKHGFTSKKQGPPVKAINLSYFTTERVSKLVNSGKAIKEKEFILIDLSKLGYNKLLGTGRIENRIKFKVESSSAGAEEKVKAADGEIIH